MFEEYLKNQLQNSPPYTTKTKTTQESYCGIYKKEYPKWEGWNIIKLEKMEGVHVSDINSTELDNLVYNFYYIQYLEQKY